MSETKFTPGPWEVVSRLVGPLVVVADCPVEIDRSGKIDVAHVGAETFAVAQANAILIASAPEMAEALFNCVSLLRLFMGDDPSMNLAVKLGNEALAKARGEPS